MKRLILILPAVLAGCKISFHQSETQTMLVSPPSVTVDGEPTEFDKALAYRVYGEPTYVLSTPGGDEITIWRNFPVPPLDKGGFSDYIVTFDANGDFTPTPPNLDVEFCKRCWQPLASHSECNPIIPPPGRRGALP